MGDICNTQEFLDMMANRRYAFVYNAPPPRIDSLSKTPYNQINPSTGVPVTQFDLNMRRKAEILKYSSNMQSTQTNNFTKKEQWAQIAKGKYQKYSPTLYTQTDNPVTGTTSYTLTCNTPGGIIRTPSYASDVPGPLTYLYEDPNVNLYMYQTNVDAYALIPNRTPLPFIIRNLGVVSASPSSITNYTLPVKFAKVIVTTGILNSTTVFTVSVPVAIRIMGAANSVSVASNRVVFNFQYPTLNAYYADTNQDNPQIPYDANTDPNSSYSLNGVYVSGGASGVVNFTVPDPTRAFGFDVYIGTVQFSSLKPLDTFPQVVYTFGLSYVNMTNSVVLNGAATNTNNYQVVVNAPDPGLTAYYRNNVSAVSGPTPTPLYTPMSILYV